ncbi:MAG: glycosyltransferase [Bdellovibrionales bacterium]|nr:glycosyltransferase [Bdellovibrionales bacterium]
MASPRLSILIPTFNRADLLSQTLKTVLAQGKHLDFTEIIISNDASKDGTADLLESFVKDHPQVQIKVFNHQKNLGGPGNWSFLLPQATGEYVFLLSDDDEISPEFLESYFAVLDQHGPLDLVYSAFEFRDENMKFLEVSPLSSTPGLMSGEDRLKNQLKANHMVMSAVYRTETLRKAGGWDARYGMHLDSAAFSLTALHSQQTYFIDKPLFYYRIGRETWSTFKVEKQKQYYTWYRLLIDDLIQAARKVNPSLLPFLKTVYGIRAQGVLNILDIKAAHGSVTGRELRYLLKDLARINPEVLYRASFYKMALVSVLGTGWLVSLRKILNKPELKNSSVFERSGS